jgi:hypothetical protein
MAPIPCSQLCLSRTEVASEQRLLFPDSFGPIFQENAGHGLAAKVYLTVVRGTPPSDMERLKACPNAQLHPQAYLDPAS